MTTFLALSFSPGIADSEDAARLRRRGRQFLAKLHQGEEPRELALGPGDWLLVSGGENRLHFSEDTGALGLVLGREAYEVGTGRVLDLSAMAELGADEFCRRVAPPLGAIARESKGLPLTVATDSCGLHHLYAFEAAEWAAVGSSSVLLGAVAEAELDAEAIGRYALIGHFVGSDSSFRGVRKLEAGARWRVAEGRIDEEHTPADPGPAEPFASRGDAAQTGAEVVAGCLQACLAEHPDAVLELSGGLDSRLLMAALPDDLRRGRGAVTLGISDSGDVKVARRLAADLGLDHRWVDIGALNDLESEPAAALAKRASRLRDYSANPFAVGVLEWVQEKLDDRPRLTGQNGEFARGFYYPGQPAAAETTPALAEALAKWRILVNDAVEVELLEPGFAADSHADAVSTVRGFFAEYGGPWLAATDRFYLEQRMQHWVGVGYSAVSQRRVVLSPFFHPDFLAWARRVSPEDRRGSRIFCEMISRFDRSLARIPLDTGLSPRDISEGGALSHLRVQVDFLRRATRKVRQRLLGTSRAAVGAEAISKRVLEGAARGQLSLDRARELPFLNGGAVEAVAAGRRRVKSNTLGLLLNLDWILEFTEG